ncbi:PEP/pyruvate-binding domain-containing protein [Nocardiopsis suaedae]|uniref:PEP-utilizing enzyme n=1 Tax=Nocardiopsis suaedae TaxID=3018444 RepID=A0ABT4TG11_9ACTN|nr:PEP/pyruvate-binding domain-containing protein [Nocardiopsis suaedae]MDA2803638.1 PEP-utilizing enzyme [Nocardiopsis suaedae]
MTRTHTTRTGSTGNTGSADVTDGAGALVAPLSAFGRSDLDTAGGKAANLGEMVRLGLPVPDGFAVTTLAYAHAAAEGAPAAALRALEQRPADGDADGDADEGAAVRAAFEAADLPDGLRTAILEAYRRMGGGPVAVRSSATAEDLPGAAFAGQQDTYLNVVGEEELLDAVRRCWASLWSGRAIAYRRRIGMDGPDVRIAVAVQKMVPAAWAGVAFTADPVTGRRDRVVVDAGRGLGESVVSGLVTPEHYLLDPHGAVVEHRAGRGEVVVRAAEGGGVVHEEGSPSTAPGESPEGMDRSSLKELSRLCRRVAGHWGRPMDIEWAVADGRVLLLQARPMTAVPPEPVRLNPVQKRIGPILLDMFQTRPYPLDMTTWTGELLEGMVAGMMKGLIGARLPSLDRLFPEEDGVVVRFIPPTPRPTLHTLAAPFRLASKARRFPIERWTKDARFTRYEKALDALAARPAADLPWDELRKRPREALGLVPLMTELRTDYLPNLVVPFVRTHLMLARLGHPVSASDLAFGALTCTEQANRALEELAELVREDPAMAEAFADRTPEELAQAVGTDPVLAPLAPRFDAFMAAYGNRETASAVYASSPTWSEVPETVLGMVKLLASEPPKRDTDSARKALARLNAHPRLRRNPAARQRAARLVERFRAGVAFREDSHFHFTRALPHLRSALLEMGRRLADEGVLDSTDEVFHLRLEELEGIADLPGLPEEQIARLRAAVRRRAAKRASLTSVPMLVMPRDEPSRGSSKGADAPVLASGTPAGGGAVTGPARVIRDPSEFGRMRAGDVLVCPYTNPSWTPLFQRASAVVVDSGGLGSHAAIVAREYGIPAVMGTGDGTSALDDGAEVRVDGDAGHVTAAAPRPSVGSEGTGGA